MIRLQQCILVLASLATVATAHGAMEKPASRNAGINATTEEQVQGCQPCFPPGSCMWFNQGCAIGCETCTGINPDSDTDFENKCPESSIDPTLPDEFRTMNWNNVKSGSEEDLFKYRPWRAPGRAPVLDSCGMSGGSPFRNNNAGGIPPPGTSPGDKGSALPAIYEKTTWRAGDVVEVRFGISANHGGGYAYRLCPADSALDEACFNQVHLDFVGNKQRLRFANATEIEIDAKTVSEGTFPEGSEWRMNPVPACSGVRAGYAELGCDGGAQFEPPPGCNELCWGYQSGNSIQPGVEDGSIREIPSVVDMVQIPRELPKGDWVISFRWDCEHTYQVWSSCGDVTIV